MLFLYQKPIMNILTYTPIVFKIIDISLYNHYFRIPPVCRKIINGSEIHYFEDSKKCFDNWYMLNEKLIKTTIRSNIQANIQENIQNHKILK